ncbi:hypothetical protein K469DRAFT_712423, partial [Zopfia rhizophila CBS 207.26]
MGVCCLGTGLRACRALKFNLSHSLTTIGLLSTPAIVTSVRTYFSNPLYTSLYAHHACD